VSQPTPAKIDWAAPLRFLKVQGDNHAHYTPRLVGSYLNTDGKPRFIVMLRHWDTAAAPVIYDEYGKPLDVSLRGDPTLSSGVFNCTIINGAKIVRHRVVLDGKPVVVTMDGNKPVAVESAA